MAATIELDREKLNESRLEKIRGVDVEVRASPYDVPRKIRVLISMDLFHKAIEIKFDYVTETESLDVVESSPELALSLGKKSQRIYEIALELQSTVVSDPHFMDRSVEAIRHAIDGLGNDIRRHTNYAMIKRLVSDFRTQIFGPLLDTKRISTMESP